MCQQLCEDVAYRMGFIDRGRLLRLAEPLQKSGYGDHLRRLADGAAAAVLEDRIDGIGAWRASKTVAQPDNPEGTA